MLVVAGKPQKMGLVGAAIIVAVALVEVVSVDLLAREVFEKEGHILLPRMAAAMDVYAPYREDIEQSQSYGGEFEYERTPFQRGF